MLSKLRTARASDGVFRHGMAKVASLDALRAGEALGVEVDGTTIALFRIGDEVHATDGICTHAYAALADGFVEGDAIECPLHQALFDIRTGKVLAGPATESLRVYPVKVAGGDVLVELGGTEPAREAPPPRQRRRVPMAPNPIHLAPAMANGRHDMTADGGTIYDQAICVARQRSHRHPRLGLYRPVHLRARGGKDLPRPHLELRGARSRGAECGRFHPLECGPDADRGGAGRGRLDQRGRDRCQHRAAEFCRELSGTAKEFVCPYHQWTYDLKGKLIGIPFRRGVAGKGGMPADFKPEEHGRASST